VNVDIERIKPPIVKREIRGETITFIGKLIRGREPFLYKRRGAKTP
jgi:hypothetical protein